MVAVIEHGLNQNTSRRTLNLNEEQKDKIRASGRNFNEEFMVNLWTEYHFNETKTFKFLYYDPKGDNND